MGERYRPLEVTPAVSVRPVDERAHVSRARRPRRWRCASPPGRRGVRACCSRGAGRLGGRARDGAVRAGRRSAARRCSASACTPRQGARRPRARCASSPTSGAPISRRAWSASSTRTSQSRPSSSTPTCGSCRSPGEGRHEDRLPARAGRRGAGQPAAGRLRRHADRDEALAAGAAALRRFDAVVVGVRAFNTSERLRAAHAALMAYVEAGGTLVVQYNTNNRIAPLTAPLGPWPFEIGRERVTDETAPVTFTVAGHPALTTPNVLGPRDFEGWIQERGLYFAEKLRPALRDALAMNDPGEPPLAGEPALGAPRQRDVRLHRPGLLPRAAGGRARRLPAVRQPAGRRSPARRRAVASMADATKETPRPPRAGRRAAVLELARASTSWCGRAGRAGDPRRGADRGRPVSALDWAVLFGTLGTIVGYGLWKTRGPSTWPTTSTVATATAGARSVCP